MSEEPKPEKVKKPRTEKQLAATARLVAMNKEKRALKLQALNEQVKAKVEEEPVVIIKKKKAKKSLNIIEENLEKPIEKPIEKQVKPKAVKKVKPPPVEKAPKVPKIKPDHVKKDKPKKKVERANLIPEPKKPASVMPASLEESSDSGLSGSDYEYTPKQIAKYTSEAVASSDSDSGSDDDEPASQVPVKTVKISHDVLEAGKGNKKSRFF